MCNNDNISRKNVTVGKKDFFMISDIRIAQRTRMMSL